MENISEEDSFSPMIANQLFEQALSNENWKLAFATGKDAQIVFMNISIHTNPKNEIGMEKHLFDQVIIIVQGNAKTILNEKESIIVHDTF